MSKDSKKKELELNLLELIPEAVVEYETEEDGTIVLLAPRFKNRLMKRIFEPRLKNPYMKIRLDEIGTSAWKSIDGSKTVGDIGQVLREEFGEDIEPCFERLSMFFSQLELSEFIRYSNLDDVRARSQSRKTSG